MGETPSTREGGCSVGDIQADEAQALTRFLLARCASCVGTRNQPSRNAYALQRSVLTSRPTRGYRRHPKRRHHNDHLLGSPRHQARVPVRRWRLMTPSRRVPRPVRLTVAAHLGSDIDGAWWPRGASLAAELTELVTALRPKLGDLTDIRVNWSAVEGPTDLHMMALGGAAIAASRRPRLLFALGTRARAKLLVIPSTTSVELGLMVMKVSAGLEVRHSEELSAPIRSAQRILLAAQTESSSWGRVIA